MAVFINADALLAHGSGWDDVNSHGQTRSDQPSSPEALSTAPSVKDLQAKAGLRPFP